jgi:tRNA(fMet)-specific endonuclease VapC
MGILIDSSVLIAGERARTDIVARARAHPGEECFISVITVSELLHGVHRATEPSVRAARLAFVEGVISGFAVLPIDTPVARLHSQLWAELAGRGELIGVHDMWLAATCLAHGFTLATLNAREFGRVPGLKLEQWTQ